MGKITKTMQSRHKETLSPWLQNYIDVASTSPLPLLPVRLSTFPTRWPFGRGDLYHWIPLLNRFDGILEQFCKLYQLREGPQTREFGQDLLLNRQESSFAGHATSSNEFELGDKSLIEAVLRFTRMLLEHCGNRSIYASSAHLNDLLNSTCLPIIIATLEVSSELAQRYQASVKRIGSSSRQISAALLANHYNIDLDRVQQLALPFVKAPAAGLSDLAASATPASAKGKEKPQTGGGVRNATSMHANDLVAIASADDKRWQEWAGVRVYYYPQDVPVPSNVAVEQSRPTVPSTPTPLRRSSSVSHAKQQQHTPGKSRNGASDDASSPLMPRTPAAADEQSHSGQKSFDVSATALTTTPIHELVTRSPSEMPPAVKYELFHRLRVAKALSDSRQTRHQILAIRLLAITNLAYIHTEANFVEKVLRQDVDETRRFQLVYQLAELIHPSTDGNTDVPIWLQSIALALLEALSGFHARCQDVLSALNANVNHGILLYVIRKAVAGMADDDVSNDDSANDSSTHDSERFTELDEWRNNLFSLTLHLSMATRVGNEMVSAGLMDILVEILDLRSKTSQRHHAMILAFLDGLIWTYPNAFSAFFNASGLDTVAKLVVDAVAVSQSSLRSPESFNEDQQSSVVDYKIPFYQQQTLKWLLKFIHHVMSNSYTYSGNTDRLVRNLADKSDLLHSLREIMEDERSFGSVVWTNSVTILSDFLNNDPTSFAAISESGMIRTYLKAITGRAISQGQADESSQSELDEAEDGDSDGASIAKLVEQDKRQHPPPEKVLRQGRRRTLAKGILASPEAIHVVPQVLNSISLNNTGLKLVVSSRAFDSFFEIFESAVHIKCFCDDAELAHNVGNSFDELARHHPSLRTSISNAVIDMVARVRFLLQDKARTCGWGAKLCLNGPNGEVLTVTEDGKLREFTESPENWNATQNADAVDPSLSVMPYVRALTCFLAAFLTNSMMKTNFLKKGGMEILLDICESPSFPATFGDAHASRFLNQVVRQLVDHSPIRTLPPLLRRTQASLDVLRPLGEKTDMLPPYFADFLTPSLGPVLDEDDLPESVLTGTRCVKALLNAQTYLKIVAECFPASRNNSLSFYPINVYDYYLNLVKTIGPLLRGVLAEEAVHLAVVPQHWSSRRHPPLGDEGTRGSDADANEALLPAVVQAAGGWESIGDFEVPGLARLTESEESSARFRNYETLRVLLHPMIPTAFPLFQALGKSLLQRRNDAHHPEPFVRSRQIEIAQALADSVLSHLAPSVSKPDPTSKDFHYWIIMLHTIHEMLIDHPSTARQPDRANVHIMMPILLAFKEAGGVSVLNTMLGVFAGVVRDRPNEASDESSRSKVAAFGLKKLFDLYYYLVHGKHLTETASFFNLQPRHPDRANPVLVFQQIVVEFRAAVLPALMELWDSSFIDKIPESTVKRLVDILKMIASGDHELQSVGKHSNPFSLFRSTNVRFDWKPLRSIVNDTIMAGYEPELAHEAMYRANGNSGVAFEYCKAFKDGVVRWRNPIPPEDADTSALAESEAPLNEQESFSVEGPSSSGPASSEADRMSLDTLPDAAGDGLRELITQSDRMSDVRGSRATVTALSSAAAAEEASIREATVQLTAAKETLDSQRAKLRGSLIEQCLDVIRAHPETAIEVSDLVMTMVIRRQNHEAHLDVGSTLTFALSSLSFDEDEKKRNGKCIAAYAHLLALLLQDEKFFERNIETLREKVEEYVVLLKVPTPPSTEELPPWIPFILLILELILCHDERPVPAQWRPPKSLEEAVPVPVILMDSALIGSQERASVLDSVLDLLPRIGKEEMLATAVLRVLVILTRRRDAAKLMGEKKNLQRLFLMAKQLSGSGSERLKQTRLTSYIITILRHVVEDDDIIKQIMRAEIQADFPNIQRNQRGPIDVTAYLRAMAPVALRAPDRFVEVTNELLEFTRWQPAATDGSRSQPLALKTIPKEPSDKEQPSAEGPAGEDVKQSTETADKDMVDAPKSLFDSKRPVVESHDGVVHFLLCELVNYREVEDKEPVAPGKDANESTVEGRDASTKATTATDDKDKKQAKPVFKAAEHPIFVYRCFLLSCLTELLQSYNRTKVEFINFKRSAPPPTSQTPIKPRTSILNYLIYDLLCQGSLDGSADTLATKKKAAVSSLTQKVLVALVAKTSERPVDKNQDKFAYDDDEPDLLFVRKFVLDTILKAYEKAPLSDDSFEIRYMRMQSLAELMNHMIGEKDKEQASGTRNSDNAQSRSQAQLRRLMYEKGYMEKLTSSIAEVSLSYPGVKRAIKYILRVLRALTATAKELSLSPLANHLPADPVADNSEEEFTSTSSLSDLDDDNREETPDLYRNSALGMLEPRGEDDESEDEDEDDEDMYNDEYDDEEMDYGDDDISEDGEDDISDEDEELSGMGGIEGLHGEPGVVEVIMDDDDDDEDDSGEDDEEDDDDDDAMDSADLEEIEDRVEIMDEDGNPIEEDGDSGWESESDVEDEEDQDEDALDYEAEVQDVDEAHMHDMGANVLLDNMARAIMGDDDGFEPDLGLDDHYLDDGHDDGEDEEDEDDVEEEELVYDDDYPHDPPPLPALDWEGPNADPDDHERRLFFLEGDHRRPVLARMDNRGPFTPRFMGGPNRDHLDFRSYFSRSHRSAGPPSGAEDGVNPLLRRQHNVPEASSRPGQGHSVGIRLPEGMIGGGRHGAEGPMGLLGELMEFLPIMGRHASGQAFHFHITGPGGARESRETGATRWPRNEQRRESTIQEPHQAVTFSAEPTVDRYQDEARMIFGANITAEASKLNSIVIAKLTPAAIELEKKLRAQEAEVQRRLEEDRKQREAEERKAREAKAAEEKAAQEQREAEEREAAERAAAEAAALEQPGNEEHKAADSPMEGVEASGQSLGADQGGAQSATAAGDDDDDHPRVMTTLRGEEVDVTELGIDPDYLAALPEEFREEVIAQTVSERRSHAREEAATGESTEVFQEFLDALPEELRLEIVNQERQDERRRQREEARRQGGHAAGSVTMATDMDPASILLTFPPELREQALLDQGEDLMEHLPPDMAAQARALVEQHASMAHQHYSMRSIAASARTPAGPGGPDANEGADSPGENRAPRRTVVQMLDKSGIATLLRLMFIAQQGSIRSYLFSVFADACENRQTRLEVVSSVLQILQEGSADMHAVERSFGHLSLKARKHKDKETDAKTPQNTKKALTNAAASASSSVPTNSETSPLLVVQQCLDLLVDLCTGSHHVPWLFLTEHEIVGTTLKRALSRKGKMKDSKAHKLAINSLLTLLERDLVTESALVMTHLADLLNRVTLPLQNMERRRRETAGESKTSKAIAGAAPDAPEGAVPTESQPPAAPSTSDQAVDQQGAPDAETAKDTQEQKDNSQKRPRQWQTPVIPPQNLTLVVRIFVARECNSKTFQNTISTIKNLSVIPGAKEAFGQELVRQAQLQSENIVSDLDDLLPHISRASSGTEIQGIALAKFSPGASEQNKLLRVLTALDHLFDGKKSRNGDGEGAKDKEKQHLVTSLYHNSTFSAMWEKLSACLRAIRQRESMLNVATILLPLIESLMVVCKNTTDDDQSQGQNPKDMVLSSPPPESRTANLFFSFTEDHRRILNELVRHNPKLMSGTFALLVKNPKVLEFDNKRNYFNRSVHSRNGQNNGRPSYPALQLSVRRDHVFHDSFKSLYFKSGDEMKFGKLNIRFHGEEGVDAGGVTREWFQVLARQMFDPNYALFIPVSSDRTTFHPNKLSAINDEHLMFFKFIGRVIGKALYEGRLLDCFFSRAVYKRILGKSVSVKDMESFDPDYYKSLSWMLENEITDIITETFSVEDDEFGVITVKDLVPNGREIAVTEENKHDYVRLVVEHKLLSSVKDQMENFLRGFHEIVPAKLISIFNEQELELLISGLPDIDIDDWKSHTEYTNYTPSSQQIQWFWRAVRSFDKEERAKLLQFVTGTSKVPLNGFKELEGMNGVNRFNIHRDYGNKDRLPSSHTCFNQMDLPEYETYDMLRSQVLKAITQGSEYFGFA